jgi:hypothetical protein
MLHMMCLSYELGEHAPSDKPDDSPLHSCSLCSATIFRLDCDSTSPTGMNQ